ncbi:MAG: hypothetical protein HZA61_11500 [Candidatus Eisenbacteria bacterium]|uniref:Uncharacterized protein n=1 Tax=Eiseniibacteriota bacterium TaxID=2212470 RepID=A0A933SEZ0_UNCEI|nr:hypothetical protein [Candidatus Eisenbacteria bacterium]
MKRLYWPVLLAIALGTGCTDAERNAFQSKCDAPLRTRVESVLQAGGAAATERLDVLGKVSGLLDAERRKMLESAGAELGTVNDALFTARIRPADVAHVAALDFVVSLQLAQVREAQ